MKVEQRLRQFNKRSQRLTQIAIGFGVIAAIFLIIQAILLSEVISGVFLGDEARTGVLDLFALMLLLLVSRSLLVWISDMISQRAASHLKANLRDRLSAHLLKLGPAYTLGRKSGELVHTAIAGVEDIDAYVTQFLPARSLAVIVPILIFVIILIIDPVTSLVLLFAGPMLILILALIGTSTKAITERRFEEMNWMSAFFLDILQGLPTLKLYGRSEEQSDNIRQISQQYGSITMDILRTAFQTSLVMEWAATAATAMVAFEVSLRLMNGYIPFNQALAVLLLTPEFFLPLRQMALQYHAGTAGKTAADHIFTILDAPTEQPKPIIGAHQAQKLPTGDIGFHNVSFAYDDGQRPALQDITLSIREGQTVALVGQTGTGKSTVAHLLMRFIEPEAGMITVGRTPLANIATDTWRTQVALVPQNPHLFHGSVADNLHLARPEATRADLIVAAKAAYAHEFIEALPQRYDTPIGEQGVRLSGGQRQRLAIARAYLKDAPILILDEASANLDSESEAQVQAALKQLAQGKTVLIIAHRLQLAAEADEIVVLADGRIAEQGQHQQLLQKKGLYESLTLAYSGGQI